MKFTIVVATVFALSSTAALAQPGSGISRSHVGTVTAPSIGAYAVPPSRFGATNVVPTWRNTTNSAASRSAAVGSAAPFRSGVLR
jgi:hypothetical protein